MYEINLGEIKQLEKRTESGIKTEIDSKVKSLIPALKNSFSLFSKFNLARAILFFTIFSLILISFSGFVSAGDVVIKNGQINATGNFTVDINSLFVDINNNRVGIGTTVPSYLLETAGVGSETAVNLSGVIYVNGSNVGVGTASPSEDLHISGSGQQVGIRIQNTDTTADPAIQFETGNIATSWAFGIDNSDSDKLKLGERTDGLHAGPNDDTHLTIQTDGNVGIRTTSPDSKLTVVGDINISGNNRLLLASGNNGLGIDPDTNQNVFNVGTLGGMQLILGAFSGIVRDYDHVTQTDPTLFIHSGSDPNTANDEWVSLIHDKNDGIISTGKGDLILNSTSGNVGVGTAAPDNLFHVLESGTADLAHSTSITAVIQDSSSSAEAGLAIIGGDSGSSRIAFGDETDPNVGRIIYDHVGNVMQFVVNGANAGILDSNAQLGIGTTTPANKLNVIGDINATGTIYRDAGTAVTDFVIDNYFDGFVNLEEYPHAKDYEFIELTELKDYLREKRHLPGLPGKKLTGPVDSAEIDRLLLEKTEEQALYIVELSEKLKGQEQEINELKLRLEKIENIG